MKRHLAGMNFRLTVYEASSTGLVVAMPGCEAPSTGLGSAVDGVGGGDAGIGSAFYWA